ncbi:MAG: ComEA family DNA-binding protein [Anaerolineae bacterium]|nr:ComEA family DNA-binding protein [Anaerolineae bacterium]
MKNGWHQLILGILSGLLGAGLLNLAFGAPRGQAISLLPPPSPSPVRVHVSGAVKHPGVYALEAGSRVEDAIQAAGGMLGSANPQSLNLAAPLEDGAKIIVAYIATPAPPNSSVDSNAPTVRAAPSYPININTATLEDLDSLPGIGPVKAQAIIDYRQNHGPFTSIDQILKVPGIGAAIYELIKDLITVGD